MENKSPQIDSSKYRHHISFTNTRVQTLSFYDSYNTGPNLTDLTVEHYKN